MERDQRQRVGCCSPECGDGLRQQQMGYLVRKSVRFAPRIWNETHVICCGAAISGGHPIKEVALLAIGCSELFLIRCVCSAGGLFSHLGLCRRCALGYSHSERLPDGG